MKAKNLSGYNNTTVRILCTWGESVTGPCEWNPPEDGYSIFGYDEESLKIGDAVIFASQIAEIELLRKEVCIPVREWPEAEEEIAGWFHEKCHVPPEACHRSIRDCLGNENGLPQWYIVVRGNRIIAGCGVIGNDPHGGNDLTPNVCAIYVEEEYRNQGVAGFMLQFVSEDMAGLGFRTLYLLTDHCGFFERYGWEYSRMVRGNDGTPSRMYVHRAQDIQAFKDKREE